jgi:hypothetical protein
MAVDGTAIGSVRTRNGYSGPLLGAVDAGAAAGGAAAGGFKAIRVMNTL